MIECLHVTAYPKLNIALKIHQKKGNLHTISSRFCLALGEIYDSMLFYTTNKLHKEIIDSPLLFQENMPLHDSYKLSILGRFSCALESNLIYKAYKILQSGAKAREKSDSIQHIVIVVDKKIPEGGGLGGGSVNAAISLLALNEILGFEYEIQDLLLFAQELGSDVAFFVIMYLQVGKHIFSYFRESLSLSISDIVAMNWEKHHCCKETTHNLSTTHNAHTCSCSNHATHSHEKEKLLFFSANIFGCGEIVKPFIESPLSFSIYCNDISCDTAAVYREFDNMQDSKDYSESKDDTTQQEIDMSLDSKTLLNTYTLETLNDLYAPASKLYHELLNVRKKLQQEAHRIYFSGSGSSFFSLKKD